MKTRSGSWVGDSKLKSYVWPKCVREISINTNKPQPTTCKICGIKLQLGESYTRHMLGESKHRNIFEYENQELAALILKIIEECYFEP